MVTKKATIRWISSQMGGRKAPPLGPQYSAPVRFADAADKWPREAWDLVVDLIACSEDNSGWTADVHFRMPDAPHFLLKDGAEFELYEGGRRVAEGHVLSRETDNQLQTKLDEAFSRIGNLEAQLGAAETVCPPWCYLVARPHAWRRQLSIKGRNMTVGQLVSTIRANRLTPEQAAADLELPLGAIQEALAYHNENRGLIELEAAEERRRLADRGHALERASLS